jgi:hypothetical protein
MDADRAIEIIETVLAPKSLNSVQIQIIHGVIAGKSYREIATIARADLVSSPLEDLSAATAAAGGEILPGTKRGASGYQLGYIRETGAQLWQSLSQRLGQKVTKNSLAAVLLWYVKQSGSQLAPSSNLSSEPGQTKTPQLDPNLLAPIDRSSATLEFPDRFYGRTEELAILTDWCLYERCRTIFLIGMGGGGQNNPRQRSHAPA